MVAANSKSRCKEQDIPFFRFSPKFDEIIAGGETDNEKLLNMIIKTKLDLKQRAKEFDEVVNLFHAVAESSKDLDQDDIVNTELKVSQTIEEEEEEEEEEGGGEEKKEEGLHEAVDGRIDNIKGLKKVLEREQRLSSTKEEESRGVQMSKAPKRTSTDEKSAEQEVQTGREKLEEEKLATCGTNDRGGICSDEFSENFLFNSISSALGGEILVRPDDENVSSNTSTPISDSGVSHTITAPIGACSQMETPEFRRQVNPRSKNSNRVLESTSSAGQLYTPYRTDTKEVDKSLDEFTEYKRETLV
jgi:hypothetical protein